MLKILMANMREKAYDSRMDLKPVDFLSALADTTRLRLVTLLVRHRELCVCELVQALDLPQPRISKHLGILRNLSIIRGRRAGNWVHYRINPDLPAWAQRAMEEVADGCEATAEFQGDEYRLSDSEAPRCGTA